MMGLPKWAWSGLRVAPNGRARIERQAQSGVEVLEGAAAILFAVPGERSMGEPHDIRDANPHYRTTDDREARLRSHCSGGAECGGLRGQGRD